MRLRFMFATVDGTISTYDFDAADGDVILLTDPLGPFARTLVGDVDQDEVAALYFEMAVEARDRRNRINPA